MKKFNFSLILSFLILTLNVEKIVTSKHAITIHGLLAMGFSMVIAIGVPVVLWLEMNRLKQGKPMNDELSKMVRLKAYSTSYFISIITWGTVWGLSEYLKLNTFTFFSVGISVMLVTGLLCWVFYKIKGVKDV